MSDNYLMEQLSENIKFNLMYPYHIRHQDLIENDGKIPYYDPQYADNYHTHSLPELLNIAYTQPKAFYLTDEDKANYSKQELQFIQGVIDDQLAKLEKGYELVTLELDEDTLQALQDYKNEHGLTFEEAVIEILSEVVKNPEKLKKIIDENKPS